MNIEEFHVLNFKSFKKLDFNLKKINIILGPNNSGKSNVLKFLLLLKQTFISSLDAPLILNGNILNFGSYKNITNNFNSKEIEIEYSFNIESIERRRYMMRYLIDEMGTKGRFSVKVVYSYDERVNKIKIKYYSIKDIKKKSNIIEYRRNGPQYLRNRDINHFKENLITNLDKLIDSIDTIPKFKVKKKSLILRNIPKKLRDKVKTSDLSPLFKYFKAQASKAKEKEFTLEINCDLNFPTIIKNMSYHFFEDFYEFEQVLTRIYRYVSSDKIPNIIDTEHGVELENSISNLLKIINEVDRFENILLSIERTLIVLKEILTEYFRNVFYIGPLRTIPQRYYNVIGELAKDVGIKGEFAHLVLKSSFEDESYKELFHKLQHWLEKFEMAKNIKIKNYKEITEFISIIFQEYFSGVNVNITDMGIGTSQVFPIILEGFLIEPGSVLIVEQPEIHLHPKAQSILGDLLIDIAKGEKTLIIETHSEYLIQRIQRRIAEGVISHNDVNYFYVTMSEEGSQVQMLELDDNGYIQNLPKGFFDDDYNEALEHLDAIIRKEKINNPEKGLKK